MLLNPRQIEAFRALVLAGGVTPAADLLGITQPAVSRLIRDLQDVLDLTLFERRGGRLVPTSEALALYAEVERSFVGLDRIANAASELRTRRAGSLNIAAFPALANGFLPRFMGEFLVDRPKLDLVVYGLVSHSVLDRVANRQSDLGFAASPVDHAAVKTERMPPTAFVAVVPQGHRLARRKKLRAEDFAGEPFISLGHSSLPRFRIDAVFEERKVKRIMRVETTLSEIACALVAGGAGLTLCDAFTATEYAPRGIVVKPFEPRIEFEFSALYSAQRGLSGVARDFLDHFRRHVASFSAELA